MNLRETIKEGNEASLQDRAKAMIFLRHHLHGGLKAEYLTIKDPYIIWQNLTERYDHQKAIILPKTRYDWIYLRLQDFKTVAEQHNELLMKNHQTRPTGSVPFPEVNAIRCGRGYGHGRGRGRSRGRGRGRSRGRGHGRGYNSNNYGYHATDLTKKARILNQSPFKNVDREMIGQNGKTQFRQN
ncbi:uncharacterized protein LOC130782060 [Actinidia eriantha]|uniref:uncharacterized protein LOC130782060 n=1 Tax=Actinidia eriantha TaxID=165200 RepID=UPI0025872475|nr:uncharacterized protein LOC130782060 [Actinidia eriantha]